MAPEEEEEIVMETETIDKSKWGEGPWQGEPDRKEWKDEASGLPCMIIRTSMGHLCGYVGVPPAHPLHGVEYSGCPQGAACPDRTEEHPWCGHAPEAVLRVHGGITYSDKCQGNICHNPPMGEEVAIYWFGFDHAHAGDWSPSMAATCSDTYLEHCGLGKPTGWGGVIEYRTIEYVEDQCRNLAGQLAAISSGQSVPNETA